MSPDGYRAARRTQVSKDPVDGIMWLCDELDRVEVRHDAQLENQEREHTAALDRVNARFWQVLLATIVMLLSIVSGLLVAMGGR